MMYSRLTAFAIVAVLPLLGFAEAGEWGHLTGRFYYDGEPPTARTVVVTKDTAAFGNSVMDESLIVNPRNRGIANVLIYLLPPEDGELQIHPSYARTEKATVDFCMRDGRFAPHILLLRTTQTMKQRNLDRVGHNAAIDFFRNTPM